MTAHAATALAIAPSTRDRVTNGIRRLIASDAAVAPMVARVVLAGVLFPHGAQHALGWFGGYGFAGTVGWMTGTLHMPATLAALGIVIEFLAPVALLLGLGGRIAAIAVGMFLSVAATTHMANGFFMNWFGQMGAGTEGFEYHLLAMALAAVVALEGSGSLSIDRALGRFLARGE